jgi:hypothetical protein
VGDGMELVADGSGVLLGTDAAVIVGVLPPEGAEVFVGGTGVLPVGAVVFVGGTIV